MSYIACRSEQYIIAFLTTIFLYSLTCSVIAQDRTREIDVSTYKIKLSLSNLPKDISKINSLSTLQFNNKTKASLRISPNKNQNLLFSYLSDDVKPISTRSSILESVNDSTIQPLAYVMTTPATPVIDKNTWDAQIKAKYKNGLIRTIAPGAKHIAIRRYTKAGIMNINVLEINPALNPNLSIEPALAGTTLSNVKKVQHIVNQNSALAGINASFFKPGSGVPLGTLVINEELITGPVYDRVVLGIKDNKFKMARISLQGKLATSTGSEIKIDNVNQPRMLSSYTILYSHRWGKMAPATPQYGVQVAIDNGRIVDISENKLNISPSGYVVIGPKKVLGNLKVNDPVEILFSTAPDWSDIEHAISGGPYLVKEGNVYVDIKEQKFGSITGRNPRTAVGYTVDDRLIMVTVDGRQKGSVGATLYELARIMKEFGCYNAMNLDGGGSTQMFVLDKVVNYPLYKGGSYVSNGLIVKVRG